MERGLVGQGGAPEFELQTRRQISRGLQRLIVRGQNETIRWLTKFKNEIRAEVATKTQATHVLSNVDHGRKMSVLERRKLVGTAGLTGVGGDRQS